MLYSAMLVMHIIDLYIIMRITLFNSIYKNMLLIININQSLLCISLILIHALIITDIANITHAIMMMIMQIDANTTMLLIL